MSTLTANLDPVCRQALDVAKRALPEGQRLDVPTLLDALFHATNLKEQPDLAAFARCFTEPNPVRTDVRPIRVDDELRLILLRLVAQKEVTPRQLFAALVHSGAGRRTLRDRGLTDAELSSLADALGVPLESGNTVAPAAPPGTTTPAATASTAGGSPAPAPSPTSQADEARKQRLKRIQRDLGEFGTLLTSPDTPLRPAPRVPTERPLHSLLQQLLTPRSRNVLLVGPPGIGKTSLLHALAQKLLARDGTLPAPLYDIDLFELTPTFPRNGGPLRPDFSPHQDYQRVYRFLLNLEAIPGVVLCVDRFYAFLGLLHRLSVHQELFDGFIHSLDAGTITCIGCLNPDELARLSEWDPSLARRFRVLQLPPPSGEDLQRIIESRRRRLEDHFKPLQVPADLLPRAVALTDEHLRERHQPEKTLRLLEAACARAVMQSEPATVLTEAHLLRAVEDFVGPVVVPGPPLTVESLADKLRLHIVGQDDVLHRLAQAVVAGRSDSGWFLRPGPRGVFLFGGPTGVGKTETALQLARLLGGGREALVRVDCQNLQGSGSGWEANTLTWRLLGVAPGYKGHVPGCRDGLLVRVRDFPECVLLFDEFEKADPAVGRLILRILDEGKAQDSEGNELDFRRCFVVLTSNAGVNYPDPERGSLVLAAASQGEKVAAASTGDLQRDLLAFGLGQEFLGRIQHVFLFRGLTSADMGRVVEKQLVELRDFAQLKGKKLEWTPEVVARLAELWQRQQNLGARYLTGLVRQHILDPLNIASSLGELTPEVARICIEVAPAPAGNGAPKLTGRTTRRREGDALYLELG